MSFLDYRKRGALHAGTLACLSPPFLWWPDNLWKEKLKEIIWLFAADFWKCGLSLKVQILPPHSCECCKTAFGRKSLILILTYQQQEQKQKPKLLSLLMYFVVQRNEWKSYNQTQHCFKHCVDFDIDVSYQSQIWERERRDWSAFLKDDNPEIMFWKQLFSVLFFIFF